MGAEINWGALDIMAEKFGVTDAELFLRELVAIRDFQGRKE